MIFVTVGSQTPFDRLIQAMDAWAGGRPDADVLAQIGDGTYEPRALRWTRTLTPEAFRQTCESSAVVVAHAGMGTVLTTLSYGRPLVLMPRVGRLKETRNDHQIATARWLAAKPGIWIANDADELPGALAAALQAGHVPAAASQAAEQFAARLRDFIGP